MLFSPVTQDYANACGISSLMETETIINIPYFLTILASIFIEVEPVALEGNGGPAGKK